MLLDDCYAAYVNLDHRIDRRERMERTLREAKVNAARVRGMLPSEYQGDKTKIRRMLAGKTPGAIGCHFSQVSIMKSAYSLCRHAFVMEDDLVFCSDFHRRMEHIEAFTRNHLWDVIWMGGTFHVNPPYWHKAFGRDAELTNDSRMVRTYGAFCTYAYIVNVTSIPKVLAMLDQQLPNSIGIDYAFIQIQRDLHTFAFVPGCITQYDNKSDIGAGMTYFSHFKKLGPYWFQDRMEDFDPTKFNWHEAKVKR